MSDSLDMDAAISAETAPLPAQPFAKVQLENGVHVASNGRWRVLAAPGAVLTLKRGRATALAPEAEKMVPLLNQLAGELLGNLDMPADEVKGRLLSLAKMVRTAPLPRKEDLHISLNGVHVYVHNDEVIVVDQELT